MKMFYLVILAEENTLFNVNIKNIINRKCVFVVFAGLDAYQNVYIATFYHVIMLI